MTATWFALLIAKWAFMKTRMFAIALERGRVLVRIAQACGFVSMIITRRDGAGAVQKFVSLRNVEKELG